MSERKIVFTLHGISSDGTWQDHVQEVLEPHFSCVPLRYEEFRRLGWLKALLGRPLTKRAVKEVAEQYAREAGAFGPRPDLIAHSFGTLVAAKLMEFPTFQFDRVIFLGSPLPCDFDWQRVLRQNPDAFRELTNEVGLRDRVIRLAGAAGRIAPHLGRAGLKGFEGPLVHIGKAPGPCERCAERLRRGEEPVKIHNVFRNRFNHHDWFLGKGHHANLWLPYLWGIDGEEHARFIGLCLDAAGLEETDQLRKLLQAEQELRSSCWSWTQGETLVSHVQADVRGYCEYQKITVAPTVVQNICSRAVRLIWCNVQEAIKERKKSREARRDAIVRRLFPPIALASAVRAAADTVLSQEQ